MIIVTAAAKPLSEASAGLPEISEVIPTCDGGLCAVIALTAQVDLKCPAKSNCKPGIQTLGV